jgi:hypothetical protein
VTTVTENDVSYAVRGDRGATRYDDSVGVGMYRIDLHPSTGGDNYIDVASSPFQIPLVDALTMAAVTPARVLGLPPLGVGAPADLVLLTDDLEVAATVVGGHVVWQR